MKGQTMKQYNKLTPAESERLYLLLEECGEVQQIVGKILRHGYEEFHPNDKKKVPTTNRKMLERELGDVFCIIEMMMNKKDVSGIELEKNRVLKEERVKKYLHHQ